MKGGDPLDRHNCYRHFDLYFSGYAVWYYFHIYVYVIEKKDTEM